MTVTSECGAGGRDGRGSGWLVCVGGAKRMTVVRRTRGVPSVADWPVMADRETWAGLFGPLACDGETIDGRRWLRASMSDLVAAVRGVDG